MTFKIQTPKNEALEYHAEGATVLECLDEARIFSVKKSGKMFVFTEECNQFYFAHLTKPQVRVLISELQMMVK